MKTFLSHKTENRRCSVGFFYFFSDCHFTSWLLLRRLHPCCGPVRRRICHFFTLSLLSLQKEQSDRCTLRLVPNESNMVGMVSRRCSHREVMRRSHRGCHARSCPWIFHNSIVFHAWRHRPLKMVNYFSEYLGFFHSIISSMQWWYQTTVFNIYIVNHW